MQKFSVLLLLNLIFFTSCFDNHKIQYKDHVKIQEGFYVGNTGVVIDIMNWKWPWNDTCFIELDDEFLKVVYTDCNNLEKIK